MEVVERSQRNLENEVKLLKDAIRPAASPDPGSLTVKETPGEVEV